MSHWVLLENQSIFIQLLLFVHAVSVLLIIERIYALYVKRSLIEKDALKDWAKGERDLSLNRVLNGLVLNIIQAKRAGANSKMLNKAIDKIFAPEVADLNKNLYRISMLANVATGIGLLGTIFAMISSFGAMISSFGAMIDVNAETKVEILSQSIGLAVQSTAYAILIALPALLLASIFQRRSDRLSENLSTATLSLLPLSQDGLEKILNQSKPGRVM